MAKGLPFLLLQNSAILKPKNQNEDIWNSNGDVPTVGNTNSCFATHFWGCRSKKWRLSLRNCESAVHFDPHFFSVQLNSDIRPDGVLLERRMECAGRSSSCKQSFIYD